mgnify:FL=1
MAKDNKTMGRFQLSDIPPAPRGVPQIEVAFDIDANGMINVSAKDKATNKEQKIVIEASSGLSEAEIEKMKKEAEENADSDKKMKEEVDKINTADTLIFTTEKQLKEHGDKLPAEKKKSIEDDLAELKKAYADKNLDSIDTAMEKLNKSWQNASEEMYKATQGQADPNAQANANASSGKTDDSSGGDDVTDVDFEEVKDDKK